ncbi:MAG: hypothetical protein ACRDVD_08270 [Acidimicrobiia bacterium]
MATPQLTVHLGPYTVAAATGFGPRLLSLSHRDGPEMFVHLDDDVVIEHPGGSVYRLHGGHRLWAAPEVPSITYAPDEHACDVLAGADTISITAPTDGAGLAKQLVVSLDGERLVVDHYLTNRRHEPLAIAPWGISQLRLGGIALLPVAPGATDDDLLADRSLVLWPYSNLGDPRLSLTEHAVMMETTPGPRLKLGSGPNPGQLGYLFEGFLFTKQITPATTGTYADRGAVGQVFVDEICCELESLGPLTTVGTGATITHTEVWEVSPCPDLVEARRRVTGDPAS